MVLVEALETQLQYILLASLLYIVDIHSMYIGRFL